MHEDEEVEVQEDVEVEVQKDVETRDVVVSAVGSSIAEEILETNIVANDPFILAVCLGIGVIVVVIGVRESDCEL